ncbi:hypothetical protein K6Q96_07080 [Grimontia kaedaensis]|uniref:Topoisomerase II n=1 Tax=Grimontia kaedaensis TaxID=2872157 RepID=A0ABY4WXQ2_9GAMM|nr:hypothetical protein [Grimontia kaedaensis]USH03748.1 hypothetical protein K6Q96_07080 [Grimontia kaedaensis]
MGVLQIVLLNNEQWVIQIANTDVLYGFVGTTLEEQALNVQQLSTAMEQGVEFLGQSIDAILELPDLAVPADVVQQLFATTDELYYLAQFVQGAIDGQTLIDILDIVGSALAEILAA